MELEGYFDFSHPKAIRVKGSRIGIEHVLYEYIHREQTPEKIEKWFDSLSLEQIYATILYYLHNRESVSEYLADCFAEEDRAWEEQQKSPPPAVINLRRRLAELKAAQQEAARDSVPA